MPFLAEGLFTEEEEAQESRFQEESECAFHCQGLRNDPTRVGREKCPVGAELEFHRDARDDSKDEGDGENLAPEMHGIIVAFVLAHQVQDLEDHQQQRQPHSELREQVVITYRKSKLYPRKDC